LILDGKIFYTTYIPDGVAVSNNVCAAPVAGSGRLYAVDLLTGKPVFDWYSDSSTELTKKDRRYGLGGGIPSQVVTIFQKKGVTLLIGSGAGAETVDPNIGLPRRRNFWLHNQIR
jgi:Tfp pilus tip-associated adhesin PilY1